MAGEWWGRGIGPSSDSVITRTDYLTVARLRAQWRRPTRSVTRVSPKKLLTRQPRTGTIYEPGPVAFRGDTHTRRVIQMQISSVDRDRGGTRRATSAPRGSCFVTDASCKSYIVPLLLPLVSLGSVAPALLPFSRWRG